MRKWWLTSGLIFAIAIVASLLDSPGTKPVSALSMLNPSHECDFCHNVHGVGFPQLLNNASVEALCLSCHGPAGPSSLKADVHLYDNSTCKDCHVSHSNVQNWLGGTNLKLVREEVVDPRLGTDRPLVFESRGTSVGDPTLHSFCDGDEDGNGVWDGACDTCHTDEDEHDYNDTGSHSHRQGQTCTQGGCHTHVTRFKDP